MDAITSATQMNNPLFPPQILPDRAVIRIAGDGSLAFLHNLLTMELTELKPAYGALLTPQGKILHDVFVVPDGEVIWIDVAAAQATDFLKKLMMYKLRAKLDIILRTDKTVAVAQADVLPTPSYADPRVATMGFRAIVDAGVLAAGVGYHEARIQHGLADSVADIGSGEMFVHEANLDQLNGVSFSKGCYVGQEVVSRTHHRHTARSRIVPVRITAVAARGTEIVSGDKRIGTMLSSLEGHGLALLRLDRLAEITLPLLVGVASLTVHKPDWATFDLQIPETAQ
jgi:tRNA-modifying protein YgfZ